MNGFIPEEYDEPEIDTQLSQPETTGVIPEEYDIPEEQAGVFSAITALAKESDDPDEMIATASLVDKLANFYNMDSAEIATNLEPAIKNYYGKIVPHKTALKAIVDSAKSGFDTNRVGHLGARMANEDDPEKRAKIFEHIQDIQKNIPDADIVKRGLFVESLKDATEIAGQMVDPILKQLGVQAALLPLYSLTGPMAPLITRIAQTAARGATTWLNSARVEQGHAYMSMIDAGIEHEVAAKYSLMNGVVSGALETVGVELILGQVPGLKNIVGKAVYKAAVKDSVGLVVKKTLIDMGVKAGTKIGIAAIGEAGTESLQEYANIKFEEIAKQVNNEIHGTNIDPIKAEEAINRIKEVALKTIRGMAVLGIAGAGVSGVVQVRKTGLDIQRHEAAKDQARKAKEAAKTVEENKVDSLLKEKEEIKTQFDKDPEAKGMAEKLTEVNKKIEVAKQDIEIEVPDSEEIINLEAEKSMLLEDIQKQSEAGKVDINIIRNLQAVQLNIDDLTSRPEDITVTEKQPYQMTKQEYAAKAKDIITEIDEKVADVEAKITQDSFRTRIQETSPALKGEEIDAIIALHNVKAQSMGVDFETYLNTQFVPEIATTEELAGELPQSTKGAVLFNKEAKALIILTKKSDFSTWIHESGHMFRRQLEGDLKTGAESYYKVVDGKWNIQQEEAFTEDLTTYLMTGNVPSEEMRSVFQLIAETLIAIYKTLVGRNEVSPEIKAVFDEMFQTEGSLLFQKEIEPEISEDLLFQPAPPTDSEAFKKWFKNSKVVDEDGEPLVVYHGTGAKFDMFQTEKKGSVWGDTASRAGFFFTTDRYEAEYFAGKAGGNIIIPAYLSIQRILRITDRILDEETDSWLRELEENDPEEYKYQTSTKAYQNTIGINPILEKLITEGLEQYNGISVLLEDADSEWFIVKNPEQIKSADKNIGTFDPEDPRILFQPAPPTDSPEFKKWFGDSKVVDENGTPLVVYHGTKRKFQKFDRMKSAQGVFWFSSSQEEITSGIAGASSSKVLMPVYLSIQKMAGWEEYEKKSLSELESEGYDGIRLDDNYVVFDAEQIKSIDNRGTFDPKNPNILYQPEFPLPKNAAVFHNVSAGRLQDIEDLHGLPMPSLAVTRKDIPFKEFGNVTLIGSKDLLEDVYDKDIWSPTVPRPEYKVNQKKLDKVEIGILKPGKKYSETGITIQHASSSDIDNGPARLTEWLKDRIAVRAAYLLDKDISIPWETKLPTAEQYEFAITPEAITYLKGIKKGHYEEIANPDYDPKAKKSAAFYLRSPVLYKVFDAEGALYKEVYTEQVAENMAGRIEIKEGSKEHKDLSDIFWEGLKNSRGYIAEFAKERTFYESFFNEDGLLNFATRDTYLNELKKMAAGRQEPEYGKMAVWIKEHAKKDDVEKWLLEILDPVYSAPQIKVGKELLSYNAWNILEWMLNQKRVSSQKTFMDIASLGKIAAAGATAFNSEAELKEAVQNLKPGNIVGEYTSMIHPDDEAFLDLAKKQYKYDDLFAARTDTRKSLLQYAALGLKKRNPARMAAMLRKNDINPTEELVGSGLDLIDKIMAAPQNYFESKPRRVLSLKDFNAIAMPEDSAPEEIEIAERNNLDVLLYKDDADRQVKIEEYFEANPDILFQTDDTEHMEAVRTAVDKGVYVPDEVLNEYGLEDWAVTELENRVDYRRDTLQSKDEEDFIGMMQAFEEDHPQSYWREIYNTALGDQFTPEQRNKSFLDSLDKKSLETILREIGNTGIKTTAPPFIEAAIKHVVKEGQIVKDTYYDKLIAQIKNRYVDRELAFRRFVAEELGDTDELFRLENEKIQLPDETEMQKLQSENKILRKDKKTFNKTLEELNRNIKQYQAMYDYAKKQGIQITEVLESAREESKLQTKVVKEKAAFKKKVEKVLTDFEKKQIAKELREKHTEYRANLKQKALMKKYIRLIMKKPPAACDALVREEITNLQGRYINTIGPKRLAYNQEMRLVLDTLEDPASREAIEKDINRQSLKAMETSELATLAEKVVGMKKEGVQKQKEKLLNIKTKRLDAIASILSELPTKKGIAFVGAVGSEKATAGSPLSKLKTFSWDMKRLSRRLGDSSYNLLVDKVNQAYDEELANLNRREEAMINKMDELNIKIRTLAELIKIGDVDITHNKAMGIYLATKNEDSLSALLFGNLKDNPDPETFIDDVLKALPDNEKEFAEWMMDSFSGEDRERLFNAFLDDTNTVTETVLNYFPMIRQDITVDSYKYSKEISDDLLARTGFKKAYPSKSMRISRIKIGKEFQTPIRIDALNVYMSAIRKQEHYINNYQLVKDLQYIYNDKKIKEAIATNYGNNWNEAIQTYINGIGNPNAFKAQLIHEHWFPKMISNSVVGALSLNITSLFNQIPGAWLYAREAGVASLMLSHAEVLANYGAVKKFVYANDIQVKNRNIDQVIENLGIIVNNPEAKRRFIAEIQSVGLTGLTAIDQVTILVGWNAVYKHYMRKTGDHDLAVKNARETTLMTQPQGAAKDAPMMYNNTALRPFLVFTRAINQMWQMITADWPEYARQKRFDAIIIDATMIAMTGLFIGVINRKRLPEDEEEIIKDIASQFIVGAPIVGGALSNKILDEWYADQGIRLPYVTSVNQAYQTLETMLDPDKDAETKIKSGVRLSMEAMKLNGLPSVATWRAYKAIVDEDIRWLLIGGLPDK